MPTLRLFASIREAAGAGRVEVAGATVAETIAAAAERFGPAFAELVPVCRVWVNGEPALGTDPVGPDDEVALLPPVSGGTDARRYSERVSDLDLVRSPEYLKGLDDKPLAELRAMRAQCQDVENALSYVRRVLHGQIDIVAMEVARRREGADPATLASIIEQLPALFAEHRVDGSLLPRPPLDFEPSVLADDLLAAVDAESSVGGVSRLPDLDAAELGAFATRLTEQEQEISEHRRRLHEIIDVLHAEIIRRYQSGEATVESLLS